MAKPKHTSQTPVKSSISSRSFEHTGNGGELHQMTDQRDHTLTTNQGVAIADDQNSLTAGERGPTLLEDFVLREKIAHFDHERIPERIVHARGSGAHGYFQAYRDLGDLTCAAFLCDPDVQTPVFARFSTVAGGAGSVDLPRDVRGFAVKFYTQEGNFDLVGNNIPVFFIQDAMKFPDLIHAAKMEPDRGYPQAATAHDTFWDFVSLMPESMHMILWAMSDRSIPRSLRMMEGFGIHTFRFVNAKGKSTFVKFHWRPRIGSASVLWDEAVKICGADPDFHRRDLYEAIERGDFPEWELGLFGQPVLSGDTLSFTPVDFKAASTNGAGYTLAANTANIQMTAHNGYSFSSIDLAERGDYLLLGGGSTADVAGQVRVYDVLDPAKDTTTGIAPDAAMDQMGDNTHPWTAAASTDLSGWTGTRSVNVSFQNLLVASTSGSSSLAYVDKKYGGLPTHSNASRKSPGRRMSPAGNRPASSVPVRISRTPISNCRANGWLPGAACCRHRRYGAARRRPHASCWFAVRPGTTGPVPARCRRRFACSAAFGKPSCRTGWRPTCSTSVSWRPNMAATSTRAKAACRPPCPCATGPVPAIRTTD